MLEKEVMLKVKKEEGRLSVFYYFVGYSQILDSDYDEELDLYYIVMDKLDEDLSVII